MVFPPLMAVRRRATETTGEDAKNRKNSLTRQSHAPTPFLSRAVSGLTLNFFWNLSTFRVFNGGLRPSLDSESLVFQRRGESYGE
jgi:hypothetical protein